MTTSFAAEDTIAVAPHFRLQWEDAQGRYVLLYPEGMVRLNDTAAEILLLCSETTSLGALLGTLRGRYPAEDLDADVRAFLGEAAANGWIDIERR